MGTNCAPLVAGLLLFCCERDFMMSLSDDTQADVVVVVAVTLLFYVHGKHLRSCRDGQLP